ncbi:MAG: GNAT family N-acetyltransferase [Anaerolineae bacterium]
MPLNVEIHSHPSAFDALADEWTALLRRSATDVPFLTPSYQRVWWRYLAEVEIGAESPLLCLVTAREGSELVGIVPLCQACRPEEGLTLQWTGCVEVSDYLDAVIASGWEDDVWAAVLDVLAGPAAPGWERMDLCNVPAVSPTLQVLPALARRRGWVVETEVQEVCPIIPLPSTWEEYLASMDGKDRHELRRKLRRAEALEGLRWYIVGPQHDLEAEMEDFLTLMARSSRAKEEFLTPPMRAFFRELARAAFAEGWLQLAFLEWNGRKLAAYLNFVYRNHVLVYNSGLDWRADPGLGAGIVLSAFLIRHAIAEGREAYDFLRGSEDYKYRLGGKEMPVVRIRVDKQRVSGGQEHEDAPTIR